jgi:hypothetical protein
LGFMARRCSNSPEDDADHGEADECSNGRCAKIGLNYRFGGSAGPYWSGVWSAAFGAH